jgi:hypothetical protein
MESIFSMEVSRAYGTFIFHQEKSYQDLLLAGATPDS